MQPIENKMLIAHFFLERVVKDPAGLEARSLRNKDFRANEGGMGRAVGLLKVDGHGRMSTEPGADKSVRSPQAVSLQTSR